MKTSIADVVDLTRLGPRWNCGGENGFVSGNRRFWRTSRAVGVRIGMPLFSDSGGIPLITPARG